MLEIIKQFVNYKYVSAFITLALVMYATLAKPSLPSWLEKLFGNTIFRVVFLSLIAFMNTHDSKVAIITAIVFMIIINKISEKKVAEHFTKELFEGEAETEYGDAEEKEAEEEAESEANSEDNDPETEAEFGVDVV